MDDFLKVMELAALAIGYMAAIIWVTLPMFYGFTAPDWRKTKTGRALMWLLGSTAAMFLLLLTGRLLGDYLLKPFVQAAIFGGVLFAGVRLAVLFVELRLELEKLIRAEREVRK